MSATGKVAALEHRVADLVCDNARLTLERDRARAQACSHATGSHDQSCDLVAGLESELQSVRDLLRVGTKPEVSDYLERISRQQKGGAS